MNFIKRLSGSFLLGLTVIGLALSTSAFTDSEKERNKFAGEVYYNSEAGEYNLLTSPYDSNNCENSSPNICAWKRTDKPGTVPNQFSATEADNLKSQGLIEEMDSKKGVYIP